MESVRVALAERSYDIVIGESLLSRGSLLAKNMTGDRAVLITNDTVAQWYAQPVQTALETQGIAVDLVVLPDGEAHKTLDTVSGIWDALLQKQYGRDVTLIALGGGVVGDMVGLAAALYQRGVKFIQIPTTLLAQVDSSVGGKTGVNHPLGKNMIGAFYQPQGVIIDTAVLQTLPQREISAGLAEVVKYGLIWDAAFFSELETRLTRVDALEPELVAWMIRRACEIKAEVEEMQAKYGKVPGLAAVLVGARKDSQTYVRMKKKACRRLIERLQLPTRYPCSVTPDKLFAAMRLDKKVLRGQLRFILLKAIGKAVISTQASDEHVLSVLSQFKSEQ
ncbi:MAG: 3-dehydroquinate synthase [Gammaproteobacteria bacterium]